MVPNSGLPLVFNSTRVGYDVLMPVSSVGSLSLAIDFGIQILRRLFSQSSLLSLCLPNPRYYSVD